MKTITKLSAFSIAIVAIMLQFSGCKKSNDNNSNPPAGTVTDIEGNIYHTVTIGNQVWMVENLKVTKFIDGSTIPLVTDDTAWVGLTTPAYSWYNNDLKSNKELYGALYNWYAVNSGKLAPTGWHIPSEQELDTLLAYLGGHYLAGGKLKSIGTVDSQNGLWMSPNEGATNESGFTAYPGGYRVYSFSDISKKGNWWSSTSTSPLASAYLFYLSYYSQDAILAFAGQDLGLSVRCIKN